ncbi:MAG: hypothetical protein OXG88_07395 [Gammaproteobacteria bacterium]|nr:hypothetical protein [Gammaproteobacteria bacterium]
MTKNNSVKNDELLYRRVNDNDDKHNDRHISDEQGNLKWINRICFHDDKKNISVFRASLMNFKPHLCRKSVVQGVVGFTAGEIRSIEIQGYKVKVCAKPDNTVSCKHNSDEYFRRIAHALIFLICIDSNPPSAKRAYRGLQQELKTKSLKRGWLVKPHS